jgi:hypothetical protein
VVFPWTVGEDSEEILLRSSGFGEDDGFLSRLSSAAFPKAVRNAVRRACPFALWVIETASLLKPSRSSISC